MPNPVTLIELMPRVALVAIAALVAVIVAVLVMGNGDPPR